MAAASDRDRQLDETMARDAIRDLVARYNSYGDSGRFEPLLALFATDAVMEIVSGSEPATRYEGVDGIAQIFTGTKQRLTTAANERPGYIRHFTATHQIDLVDADHATGRSYFQVLMAHGLDHWGRYLDRYVRIDGQWRFEHRKVHVDGRVEQSWFNGPAPVAG